jgi:tetratricopeptide (TPR) repeat protein
MQEDSNDETNRTVRESHSYLGIAAAETNEHSYSLLHKQKWLDMLLSRTDDNGQQMEDYELGYAYNEIGVAYGNTNLLDKAAEAFTRSIEIFQASTSFEDTDLGWPQPNLGFIYWMQGKLSEAEEVLVEILDIHTAEWGTDDTTSFKFGTLNPLLSLSDNLQDWKNSVRIGQCVRSSRALPREPEFPRALPGTVQGHTGSGTSSNGRCVLQACTALHTPGFVQ